MPKVALVAHWDWVLHNFRLPIAAALRDRGCEVVLVCPPGRYVAALEARGFAWRAWQVDRRSLNPVREASAILRLARLYRSERPDVVHHFTAKPNLYGTLAARAAGVPQVINTWSGLGFLFSDDPRARRARRLAVPVMRTAFRPRNVWTLVQHPDDLDLLARERLAVPARTRLVRSGVDTERFSPAPAGTRAGEERVVALMAGRLLRDKGVAELVGAARLLAERGVPVLVRIAGGPDPGNPASIPPGQLAAWQREGVIELLGPRDDMPEVIRAADLAVLPSAYGEGIPRFLLEAAACGLPLVATDLAGCREVVVDAANGLLVPVGDVEALAGALERLALDPSLRQRAGLESRRIAVERFGEDRFVAAHLDLYRDLGLVD